MMMMVVMMLSDHPPLLRSTRPESWPRSHPTQNVPSQEEEEEEEGDCVVALP
jgi:hypothetical protein